MASKVTAWQTTDGKFWSSAEEADLHEILFVVERHLRAAGLRAETVIPARYGLETLLRTGKFTLTYNEGDNNAQAPSR